MIIALASPRLASSVDDGLDRIRHSLSEAVSRGAEIVCFPEAYLPGLRGMDFDVPPFDRADQERAVKAVRQWAKARQAAVVLGMEWLADEGRRNVALVVDAGGAVLGYQTKNQLDPSEDRLYVPGRTRQVFEINGLRFGVAICHEGWRYPETVRWAAIRGAKVVFHPHCTGSDTSGISLTRWGDLAGPYYERAMISRSLENTIYFASVNYALRYQESATTLISPSGECVAYLPYGQEGVLVQALDQDAATGQLASRYAPDRYEEVTGTDRAAIAFNPDPATIVRRPAD